MSRSSGKLYEFGAFRLDAAERVLWRGEEMIVLPPKVFDTLWALVKEEGRVVSKSELMEAVWANAAVEESNLSQNIYTLRRALGVDEQGRRFIETVPRRGYRLAVPVRLIDGAVNRGADDSQAAATQSSPVSPSATAEKEISPRSVPRYVLFVSLGVVILSALGFGVYQFINRRGEKEQVAPIEQVRFQRLTDSGDVVYPTISPNGELLAYARLEEEQGGVWIKRLMTGNSVRSLPPSQSGYRSLAFSPDGQYLFFRDRADPGAIYQTPVFGGEMKKVADNVWSDFSVSPDGGRLAFIRRDGARGAHSLILSNIDGGAERELSVRRSPQEYGDGAPAWTPDGSKLVVTAGLERQSLLTVDSSTGEEKELGIARWRTVTKALWTPDGKRLIFTARATDEPYSQLWMFTYPDGPLRRLTNDLEGYFWISLSADGRKLVTRQQRMISRLWLLPDGDVRKARQLTFGERGFDGYSGLAWTADGRIIFSSFSGAATDLYSMKPDGSGRVRLTANAGQDNAYPAVSADGRYIVFTSNRSGSMQIWRMDTDGRNQRQLTFGDGQKNDGQKNDRQKNDGQKNDGQKNDGQKNDGQKNDGQKNDGQKNDGQKNDGQKDSAQYAALSPDGREVFFIRRGAEPAAIWKVSIDGGTPVRISRLNGATAGGFLSISPDGKWLAYHHVSASREPGEERALRIGVLPADGAAAPKLFDLPMRRPITQWTTDSRAFDYVTGLFNASSLWRQPIAGGVPKKLCDFSDLVFNLAWARDGKNLVVSRGEQRGDALLIPNLP